MLNAQSFDQQTFTNEDFSHRLIGPAEYVDCTFRGCQFVETSLSSVDFIDCFFIGCTWSQVTLKNTALKNVQFEQCQLPGVHFSDAVDFLFEVSFTKCTLDYSMFHRKKLKKTRFVGCSLKNVDFEQADLSEAVFDDCNLHNAHFSRTNLTKADFRTTVGYTIDPEVNTMTKARFALAGTPGLLRKYGVVIEGNL